MCITFFCIHPPEIPGIKFMIAFNRQEVINRETLPFGPFQNDLNIYAGKDLISGGSWMGINISTGIMVILTNYVDCSLRIGESRGTLVKKFLNSNFGSGLSKDQLNQKIKQEMTEILSLSDSYSPFNLVVYSIRTDLIFYINSQTKMSTPELLQGSKIHGLTNTNLHKKWPKAQHGCQKFEKIVKEISGREAPMSTESIMGEMYKVMRDERDFPEHQGYPQTSIFIKPYFNQRLQAQKMTRSTFMGIFRQNDEGKVQADVRECTYNQDQSKFASFVKYSLII